MAKRLPFSGLALLSPFILALACGGTSTPSAPLAGLDLDHNGLADDLGRFVGTGSTPDTIDINKDGIPDGPKVDVFGDGKLIGLGLDTNCDGIIDGVDTNGDGVADVLTSRGPTNTPGCQSNPFNHGGSGGSGGAGPAGGAPAHGGSTAAGAGGKSGGAGAPGTAGAPSSAGAAGASTTGQLGKGVYQGSGDSTTRFEEDDVYRNGVGYKFIANGWGTGWQSHHVSWNGTSFKVLALNGSQGMDFSPAGYPTMFCGLYSQKQSDKCGLPGAISSLTSVKTGWRWVANGNNGQYNAAWDIWLGNSTTLSSYLMVWLRDPPGQQPAGSAALAGVTITGVPGSWNIWKGTVRPPGATADLPIVNYVQQEGHDMGELEFDVLDVYRDAIKRSYSLPGTNLLAVAVGYEVWNGPITNLVTEDFYVDVK